MAQSHNPNAQLQKKIDDMQLELAAVRSEASRTQKILHLTKEDLAQAQEELLYKSKTTPPQMPMFGQDVEMHSEKSQNPGVERELALAREQIASLTQEGEKSKQMIKDLLRDIDALCRKSGEPWGELSQDGLSRVSLSSFCVGSCAAARARGSFGRGIGSG